MAASAIWYPISKVGIPIFPEGIEWRQCHEVAQLFYDGGPYDWFLYDRDPRHQRVKVAAVK